MRGTTLALVGVLVALHWRGAEESWAVPLSMFRDGNHAGLGYSAFAILILMGVVMSRAAHRSGEFATSAVYTVATVMLGAIAATPSADPFHVLLSLLLPLVLHAFYLWLLHSRLSFWMFLHLTVPLLLLVAVQFQSFGAWQKSLLIYFVLLANWHYGLLPHPVGMRARKQSPPTVNREFERLIAEGWIDKKADRSFGKRQLPFAAGLRRPVAPDLFVDADVLDEHLRGKDGRLVGVAEKLTSHGHVHDEIKRLVERSRPGVQIGLLLGIGSFGIASPAAAPPE